MNNLGNNTLVRFVNTGSIELDNRLGVIKGISMIHAEFNHYIVRQLFAVSSGYDCIQITQNCLNVVDEVDLLEAFEYYMDGVDLMMKGQSVRDMDERVSRLEYLIGEKLNTSVFV